MVELAPMMSQADVQLSNHRIKCSTAPQQQVDTAATAATTAATANISELNIRIFSRSPSECY